MADIIDRLISRVEFVGIAVAISSIKNVTTAQERLEKQQGRLASASAKAAAAQDKLNRAHERMMRSINSPNGTYQGFQRAQAAYLGRSQQASNAYNIMNTQQRKVNAADTMKQNARGDMMATIGGVVGVYAAQKITELGAAAMETSIKFENLRTSLTVLYRDAAVGEQAFEWVKNFAKQTPFSVESATQAFIRLTTLGIQPTVRNLKILGGLGNMFGRDFSDVAMAAGIGAAGNFSRLIRGFGIRREDVAANAPKGTVPLQGAIAAKDRPVVFEAILKTIEQKFPGAFDRFAATTETARSNFYDSVQQVLASMAKLAFGSDSLKKTFDGLRQIAGFVNNVIKALDIFKGALILGATAFTIGVIEILDKVTFGLLNKLIGGKLSTASDYLAAAGQEQWRQMGLTLQSMSKYAIASEPPQAPLGKPLGGEEANTMANAIRQIVGQSGIAQIGVNASELPGLGNPMKKPPVTVKVEGSNGSNFNQLVEEILNKFLYDANRHGYSFDTN
jgi:hypothetical protein